MPGGEAPQQFTRAAKRRSNLRGRAGIKDKLYFSRSLARLCGINSTAQTQRKKKIKFFCPAAKRRSNLRGRASKNNAFCFSRRRCDCLQHSRKNKQKRYILSFAKPCPFVRHKFHRTNSGKNKIQVLLSRFSSKEKRARSRARSSRRPPQRAKDLIRSKSAGKSEFFSRKAAKKEGKPSPGVFP